MKRFLATLLVIAFAATSNAIAQDSGPVSPPGVQGPLSATNAHIAVFSGTSGQIIADGGAPVGTGTVTSVTCGSGLTGGTITGSGTCAVSLTKPTYQVLTSGTSATYTTPAGTTQIIVTEVGPGGGSSGSGVGNTAGSGGQGGNTIFGVGGLAINAEGGSAGAWLSSSGGIGGTGGSGSATWRIPGQGGGGAMGANTTISAAGSSGGSSCLGGGAAGDSAAVANSGGGGGGSSIPALLNGLAGPAGGGGECAITVITSPASTYLYTIGSGGGAGMAGTTGNVGHAGGSGEIIVQENYN